MNQHASYITKQDVFHDIVRPHLHHVMVLLKFFKNGHCFIDELVTKEAVQKKEYIAKK